MERLRMNYFHMNISKKLINTIFLNRSNSIGAGRDKKAPDNLKEVRLGSSRSFKRFGYAPSGAPNAERIGFSN